MVVKQIKCNKGQSILEVVFILPFLFLFVGILFKLNMGIQQSINNTQFTHSQIYVLTANSPEYPRLQFTRYDPTIFSVSGQDMMVLGVSDPKALTDRGDGTSKLNPIPQSQKIARNKSVQGSEEGGEPSKRTNIRIRNTSAICTQLNALPKEGSIRWPFGLLPCRYQGMDES